MNSDKLAELVVGALEDIKGLDIVKLDVRDMTTVTDWMIVASGTSNRHVQALIDKRHRGSQGCGTQAKWRRRRGRW